MYKEKPIQSKKTELLLLQAGRILDPASGLDVTTDMVISRGKIDHIGQYNSNTFSGKIIPCKDITIVPGLIDMHVHLREPGNEDKETIASGCRAAMAGGFTAVCCMPNTHPPIDNRGQVEFVRERAEGFLVDVHPVGAITQGLKGEELTEMGDMVEAGAVAFSDDGYPVENAAIFRRALEYAHLFGHPIIEHSEDMRLSANGVMNEGYVATCLGMQGIPPLSEEIAVGRNLMIAEYTKGILHIAHVSTAGAVRMIREARARGVQVTVETCPHYLVLTDNAVRSFDTNLKMKPPLRTEADQKALLEGLKDGTIDVIATDHAPHTIQDKETEFDAAAFGIIGLETAVGLILTELVHKKILRLEEMIWKMAILPRKILNLPENLIEKGNQANLTLLDPMRKWTVDKTRFQSRARNTPFDGLKLKGMSVGVIHNGQICLDESV